MNKLINVIESEGRQLVSARELYLGLGYDKSQYSRWCKKNILENTFFEHYLDYTIVDLICDNPIVGRPTQDYLLTLPMAKSLVLKIRHSEESGEILRQLDDEIIIHHTVSRFEYSFGNMLIKQLSVLDIAVESQKRILDYRIDFYIDEYNLAIEYDEYQHFTSTMMIADAEREQSIKNCIGCDFIRLDWRVCDAENVAIVIKEIINRIKHKITTNTTD